MESAQNIEKLGTTEGPLSGSSPATPAILSSGNDGNPAGAHGMHTKRRRRTVRSGRVVVPVYRIKRSDGRVQWRVRWTDPVAGRKEQTFPTEREAEQHALAVALQIDAQPQSAVFTLSDEEKRAVTTLRRAAEASSAPIGSLISDFLSAREKLPPGTRLSDLSNEWLRRHPATSCPSIDQIVAEFIAVKRSAGRSDRHVQDLEYRLGAFVRAFRCRLDEITGRHVEDWLDRLGVAQRTRTNHLSALANVVGFAERRRYIPRGTLEIGRIERGKTDGEVGVFTPSQLREILTTARSEIVPFLALGAFAGLRHAEAARIEWGQIWAEWVEVKAKQSKTRARRLVPVLPTLRAWVEPLRRTQREMVCPLVNIANEITDLSQRLSFPWVRNGLRHSFASYRLAETQHEGKVAVEMGNSPAMIVQHYRALVTPEAAREWFAVIP